MKILNSLTIKHLLMNKKRTIVTIIGVMLSCSLMVGVGLMFSSLHHNIITSTEIYSGKHHVLISEIDGKNFNLVKQNGNVKSLSYQQDLYVGTFGDLANRGKSEITLECSLLVRNASDEFFDLLKIEQGRRPSNNQEIILPIMYETNKTYHIGDNIKIDELRVMSDNEEVVHSYNEMSNLKASYKKTNEYKIVGFYYSSNYNLLGSTNNFYTKEDVRKYNHISAYITYYNIKDTKDNTEALVKRLNKESYETDYGEKEYSEVEYNWSLLSLYGQSSYDNYNVMTYQIMAIILGLISIACIIVIYNSFNISVMERKKQFGLFSSIGATKKQLRHTVFYEAIIISIIGIPLGLICGYIGIDTVIKLINYLIPDVLEPALSFHVYPSFIYIPVLFMIIVIFLSALIPSKRASKATPIDLIRQNDDIKMSGKKVKSNRLIKKIFGVEGDIALKNIRRNKKKYRITIISLFISIVLFISFSGLLQYGLYGSESMFNTIDYDASIYMYDESLDAVKEVSKEIIKTKGVTDSILVSDRTYNIDPLKKEDYNKKFYNNNNSLRKENYNNSSNNKVSIIKLDEKNYQKYLDILGLYSPRPIVLNYTDFIIYGNDNTRKSYSGPWLNEKDSINIYTNKESTDDTSLLMTLDNVYYATKSMFGLGNFTSNNLTLRIVVNEEIFNTLQSKGYDDIGYTSSLLLKLDKDNDLKSFTDKISDSKRLQGFSYENVYEMEKINRNMILVIKILLYGFISLVTLIGITSVFNTINTSLLLRKKEFAMLRSVGLTSKGFNKILWFESLFFVFKSLVYALPVSFIVILLLRNIIGNSMVGALLLIPWSAVIIAIIFSFIVVLITTIYSTRKMRKENILEAIRVENI